MLKTKINLSRSIGIPLRGVKTISSSERLYSAYTKNRINMSDTMVIWCLVECYHFSAKPVFYSEPSEKYIDGFSTISMFFFIKYVTTFSVCEGGSKTFFSFSTDQRFRRPGVLESDH